MIGSAIGTDAEPMFWPNSGKGRSEIAGKIMGWAEVYRAEVPGLIWVR
jgi:hypothetical protein